MEKEKSEIKPEDGMKKAELISLVFEMGYTIAIPIVVFALLGRWADKHFSTSPLFILVGIGLALFITGYFVYKKISKILY